MNDNQEKTATSKCCLADEKIDEIEKHFQAVRDYYKKTLAKEHYMFFDDKSFYLKMLWRKCPEKLLYPAVDQWKKALENYIDPLDIFLLGWHTGRLLSELERRVTNSIRGRLHRTGHRTDQCSIDPKMHKIYDDYNSSQETSSGKKITLNRLLQDEFHIKDITKPNAELNRWRAQYYRAKHAIESEKEKEDIPEDYHSFFTEYLDFLIRYTYIGNYDPVEDHCNLFWLLIGERRTSFSRFLHEKADLRKNVKSIERALQRKNITRQHKRRKDSDEMD